jgi:hypothetical protein
MFEKVDERTLETCTNPVNLKTHIRECYAHIDALQARVGELERAASFNHVKKWTACGWQCGWCRNGTTVHDSDCPIGELKRVLALTPPAAEWKAPLTLRCQACQDELKQDQRFPKAEHTCGLGAAEGKEKP